MKPMHNFINEPTFQRGRPALKAIAITALALFAAAPACGDDDDDNNAQTRTSGAGESCLRTADCNGTLVCIGQICVDAPPSPPQPSRRGESCRISSECATGLSCVGDRCVVSEFAVTPTANECKIIECKAAQDCCPEPSAFCSDLKASCDQELAAVPNCATLKTQCDAGDTAACSNYATTCPDCRSYDLSCPACEVDALRCDAGSCRTVTPCQGGACVNGNVCDTATNECVDCVKNEDCGDVQRLVCNARRCEARCTDDTDCADFNRCVNNACVASGCKTDRECKALTGNVLSVCNVADGTCAEPCESDPECSDGSGRWNFRSCIDKRCVYVGCETDKECQIFMGQDDPFPPLPGDAQRDIVCLPRAGAPAAAPLAPG